MRRLFNSELVERLLFTAIVVGIFMVAGASFRYLNLSNQLSGNIAAQIHESGGEVELESKTEAQGLMAADIQRRRITSEQYNMMIIGGAGLALLGLGWLGYDIMRGRRRKAKSASAEASVEPSAASAAAAES